MAELQERVPAPRARAAVGVTVGLLAVVLTARLAAQCPDGTPPPCARRGVALAVDAGRVAVLPFRVTTADSLLGEGFAELLASEFTGQGGPRAIDMASVLSSWRRAGGGLRTPIAKPAALRMAQGLGAGLLAEGSIVGLGSRITVTATLYNVPDGAERARVGPVTGPGDSLDAVLRRTATGLLAAVGGQARPDDQVRFTESPAAIRAYLEGLSAWRRGRLQDAVAAFDRAVAGDSAFAQAVFRRYTAAVWGYASPALLARMAWALRGRLSPQERTVLEGILGAGYPYSYQRTMDQRVASRVAAADALPDSPDALYFAGDLLYHYGGVVDPLNHVRRAREYLERAAAIDSQATVLQHLFEIGLETTDTALIRRVWPAFARTDYPGKWAGLWLAEAQSGDPGLSAWLRRTPPPDDVLRGEGFWPAGIAAGLVLPAQQLDQLYDRFAAVAPDSGVRDLVQVNRGIMLAQHGRPAAAERVWATLRPQPRLMADQFRIVYALLGQADDLDVSGALARLAQAPSDSAATETLCLAALWRGSTGDSVAADLERWQQRAPECGRLARLVSEPRPSTAEFRRLVAETDSTVRLHIAFASYPFVGAVLAGAWEQAGDPARARAALHYHPFPLFGDAMLRQEGRLAALAGDTAGAVAAYRRYLLLHQDAEPVLIPRRDSVRAELARLERP